MSQPAPHLEATALQVTYGRVEAVAGLDLWVQQGEMVGLIGPDGAGKTSALRVLAGLLRPTAGEARAFGEPVWQQRHALRRRLGYLAQRFALYGDLTVDENIQFFALLYGVPGWRSRRDELLARVGLAPFRHRLADHLSGGMKQKLALACTLIHGPQVLILDEPTTGVDPVTRRELWRLLGDEVAQGLSLLVATPYLDEAERCSRVLLLHRGRLLAQGSPAALKALLPGQVVRIEGGERAAVLAALAGAGGVSDAAVFGAAVHARLENEGDEAVAHLAHTLAGGGLHGLVVRRVPPSLEDTFLYLTAASAAPPREAA